MLKTILVPLLAIVLADFDIQPGGAERQARALGTFKPAPLPGVDWLVLLCGGFAPVWVFIRFHWMRLSQSWRLLQSTVGEQI